MPPSSPRPNRRAPSARAAGSGRPARPSGGGARRSRGSTAGRGDSAGRTSNPRTGSARRSPGESWDRPAAGSGRGRTSSRPSGGAQGQRRSSTTGASKAGGTRRTGGTGTGDQTGSGGQRRADGTPRSGRPTSRIGPTRSATPRGAPKTPGERGRTPQRRSGAPSSSSSSRGPRASGAASGRRPAAPPRGAREDERPLPSRTKSWGNVARRGAREVQRGNDAGATGNEPGGGRDRRGMSPPPTKRTPSPNQPQDTSWVRDDGAREWSDSAPRPAKKRTTASTATSGRGAAKRSWAPGPPPRATARDAIAALSARHAHPLPPELAAEIRNAADTATAYHRERLVERAESAYGSLERGRDLDALRAIKPVADEVPTVAGVRELAGLAAYRSGRWREAVRHLQAFCRAHRLDGASPDPDGLPACAAQAQEGG